MGRGGRGRGVWSRSRRAFGLGKRGGVVVLDGWVLVVVVPEGARLSGDHS